MPKKLKAIIIQDPYCDNLRVISNDETVLNDLNKNYPDVKPVDNEFVIPTETSGDINKVIDTVDGEDKGKHRLEHQVSVSKGSIIMKILLLSIIGVAVYIII
jgi:hypothetical protein